MNRCRQSPEFYRQRGAEGLPYLIRLRERGDMGHTPPIMPWTYAPKPERCGHCGVDGALHLMRIQPNNGDEGDGWSCVQCGWTLYDPGPMETKLRCRPGC